MKIRTRTAVLVCGAAVLLTAAGIAALLLRPERLRATFTAVLQGTLREGFVAEIDAVRWSSAEGLRVEGLRIRDATRGETLLSVPALRASTRLWALLRHGRVTDVRAERPEVRLDRLPDGSLRLAGAFRPAAPPEPGAEPAALPRIRVEGGTVRFTDSSLLAEGETVVLEIESLEVQEGRPGHASAIEGRLRDTGSTVRPGEGGLGPVLVRGQWPPGREGLHVLLQEFEAGDALRNRLSDALRAAVEPVAMEGPFGEAGGLPGLEVILEQADEARPVGLRVVARPADLAVVIDGFPALFTGVRGEIRWADGIVTIPDLALHRSGAEFHIIGTLDLRDPSVDPGGLAVDVRFWARDLYLDRGIRDALPPGVHRVWDAYDFSGTVDITEAAPDAPGSFDSHVRIPRDGGPADVKVAVSARDGFLAYHGMTNAQGMRYGFDYPITGARGRVDVRSDGTATRITLRDIEGNHGDVRLRASGEVLDYHKGRSRVEIHIVARDLPLDRELAAAFDTSEVFDRWAPEGIAAEVQVGILQDLDLDRYAYTNIVVRFDGRASFSYSGFPLRLRGVEGVVEEKKDRVAGALVPRTTLQGIRGSTEDGSRLQVDGTVQGEEAAQRLNLTVRAEDLLLDTGLRSALAADPRRAKAVEAWDSLGPSGRASGRAEITGTERDPVVALRIDLDGRTTVQGWDRLRQRVEGIEGSLTILPDEVTLRGIRGRGEHGEVRIPSATIRTVESGTTLDLLLEADDFPMDESTRASLGPVAERSAGYYEFVRPQPGLRADLRVQVSGDASAPAARVVAENVQGGLAPLGLRNLDVGTGRVVVDGGVVTVTGVEASMANRDLVVKEGRLDLDAGTADLAFEVRRLRWPRDLLGILTPEAADAIEALAPDRYFHVEDLRVRMADQWRTVVLDGDLSLSPRRAGAAEGLGLEGVFGIRGLTFRRGPAESDPTALSGRVRMRDGIVLAGVRLEDIAAVLDLSGTVGGGATDVTADVSGLSASVAARELDQGAVLLRLREGSFLLQDLRARFAGGDLTASVEAPYGRQKFKARVSLQGATARDLFAPGDPRSPLEGRVGGTLDLNLPSEEGAALRGTASAELRDGRLFEVPVFAAIYSMLPVKEKPVFTSGSLVSHIRGDEIILDEFALRSSVLDLEKATGGSRVYMDGRLDIGITPVFKQVRDIFFIGIPLNALLSNTLGLVYQRIHQIRVTGTVKNPVASNTLLPGILGKDDLGYHVEPPPPAVQPLPRPPMEW